MDFVSAHELGEFLGKAERTVRDWVKRGILPRSSGGKFDVKACTSAAIAHFERLAARTSSTAEEAANSPAARKDAADCRLAEAKAAQEELRLAEMQGKLVPTDQVREQGGRMVAAFRQRLLSLPTTLAAQVREAKDTAAAEKILRRGIYEALAELAVWDAEDEEVERSA